MGHSGRLHVRAARPDEGQQGDGSATVGATASGFRPLLADASTGQSANHADSVPARRSGSESGIQQAQYQSGAP